MNKEREGKTDARDALVEMISEEMKRIKDMLGVFKQQIEQTQLVVDREQQRNADLAAELRTIHENLETLPRQDIRNKYEEALDARFRLTTMRGQLEKFQTAREYLEKEQALLSQLVAKIQGVEVLSASDDGRKAASPANINIVRIVQAQEDERKRLALQIHDGPAQSLTNFILQAEICQRLFDRNPAKAAEELTNLKSAASSTFQKVRDFIFDLRPMMLDDLGVVPTVRRYVDSFREKNDMDIKLDIAGEERRLEQHREVILFRAIQELMTHARDYSNATEMTIRMDMSGNRIKTIIEDNGRGFDAEAVFMGEEGYTDARSQSLITQKERFELVGGSVSVQSDEKEGTTVRLELPVSDGATGS